MPRLAETEGRRRGKGASVALARHELFGMSVPDAIRRYLSAAKQPKTHCEMSATPQSQPLSEAEIDRLHQELLAELRRARRILLMTLPFILVVVAFGTFLAIRFPAPSVPALIAAIMGHWNAVRLEPAPSVENDPSRYADAVMARTLAWSLPTGAVCYGVLAALRIGVPEPVASLPWRVLGGVVIGSVAGLGATCVVCLVGSFRFWRGAWRAA